MAYTKSKIEVRDRLRLRFPVVRDWMESESFGYRFHDAVHDTALPDKYERVYPTEAVAKHARDNFILSHYLNRMASKTNDGRTSERWSEALDSVHVGDWDRMLNDNLIPIAAFRLRAGDRVAARQSWFGMSCGDVKYLTVAEVTQPDECSVHATFTTCEDGPAECDDGELIWIVNPPLEMGECDNCASCTDNRWN